MSPSLPTILFSVALLPTGAALYLAHIKGPHAATAALAWASLNAYLVAIASLGPLSRHTTGLLGKSSDGRIHLWSWLLFWPYHLGLRVKLYIGRALTHEPLYSRIHPGLYLGGWAPHARHLPPGKVSVVDVTCELPRTHNHRYLVIKVWDTAAPSVPQIQQAVEFACSESAAGRPVFVHCAHGHGRSATVVGACLMKLGLAGSVDQAVQVMKSVRPYVHLSRTQRHALDLWAERLLSDKKELELARPLVIPSSKREVLSQAGAGGLEIEI